jgi:signal transduction histidine kinase
VKAVENQVSQLESTGRFKVEFNTSGTATSLGCARDIALFRIIQESINNIIKHSRASIVSLNMDYGDDELDCSIHDNGIGFNSALNNGSSLHSGMSNMKKRSDFIGGKIDISSTRNHGTHVRICIPITKP